jgi:undecaprenyl-diphosphatase
MSALSPLLGPVGAADLRLSDRLRAWTPPRWFQLWMIAATRFGDGAGWIAVGVGLLAAGPQAQAAAAAATVAALVASAAFMVLKRRFRRRRPCDLAPHPVFQVRPPDAFSFPSGHTMNAFAIASVLALRFPPLATALYLLAGCVGTSRVVLGLHFASDVAAGAVLGALIGRLTAGICP